MSRTLFFGLLIFSYIAILFSLTYYTVRSKPIQHKEIIYPANAQPYSVQCGDQPCVVFYDMNLKAVVALMLDGSTITVKPETEEVE